LKTIKISVEDWKRLFGTFAHDALNSQNGNTVDDYLQALIDCEAILPGKETGSSFFIQVWKPEFRFVIITIEDILDPLTLKVFVIGLNGCSQVRQQDLPHMQGNLNFFWLVMSQATRLLYF
jgi:hypothetical protein